MFPAGPGCEISGVPPLAQPRGIGYLSRVPRLLQLHRTPPPGDRLPPIVGRIVPATRVVSASLLSYPWSKSQPGALWYVEAHLKPDRPGFRLLSLRVDAGDKVLPPHRAITRDRILTVVAHAAVRLEDASIPWKPVAYTDERLVYRGVEVHLQQPDGSWRPMGVNVEGPGPVPRWYTGLRRLALADFLRGLDFSNAECQVR